MITSISLGFSGLARPGERATRKRIVTLGSYRGRLEEAVFGPGEPEKPSPHVTLFLSDGSVTSINAGITGPLGLEVPTIEGDRELEISSELGVEALWLASYGLIGWPRPIKGALTRAALVRQVLPRRRHERYRRDPAALDRRILPGYRVLGRERPSLHRDAWRGDQLDCAREGCGRPAAGDERRRAVPVRGTRLAGEADGWDRAGRWVLISTDVCSL